MPDLPTLRVIYRSCGSDNRKRRPSFYSKDLALASFLQALEPIAERSEVLFLNDGPLPEHRMDLMRRHGEVLTLPSVGNRRSYRTALALPRRLSWPGGDLVWFAEDDYLYRPHAFTSLLAAERAFPEADYFALYASVGERPPEGGEQPAFAPVPAEWADQPAVTISDGTAWSWALSHTATYGARVRAVNADRTIFVASLYTASAWDHTACLAYQGFRPWTWANVLGESVPDAAGGPRRLGKRMAALPCRAAVMLMARRRRHRPHRLVSADPALCTHMEDGVLALGTDWALEAAGTPAYDG